GSQSITLETGCWIADKLTTFLPFSFLVDGCVWVEGSSVYSSTYSYSSSMLKKFLNLSFILIVTASFLTISDNYRAVPFMFSFFFYSRWLCFGRSIFRIFLHVFIFFFHVKKVLKFIFHTHCYRLLFNYFRQVPSRVLYVLLLLQ